MAATRVRKQDLGANVFATPSIALGTAASAGSTGQAIQSDATILAFDATNPAAETSGAAAVVGVATTAARRDHVHAMPTILDLIALGLKFDYRRAMLATAPVGYWRLGLDDIGGAIAADQMGANTGTYVGAPTLGVAGLLTGDPDTAVTFNGSTQYMHRAGGVGSLSSWSISLWVNGTAAGFYARLFEAGTDVLDIARQSDGTIALYDGAGWLVTGLVAASSTIVNIVFTFNGSSLCGYQNGVLTYGPGARGRAISGDVWFGSDSGGASNFPGTIDEPAIWDRALSAAEVATLYAVGALQ